MNAVLTEEHSHGNENLGEPRIMTGGQDLFSFSGCLSSPPCFTKKSFHYLLSGAVANSSTDSTTVILCN
jgi:hypothetical protein